MRNIFLIFPLVLFITITIFLYKGLENDPSHLPSALIGKNLPQFELETLLDREQITDKDILLDEPFLLNVWATWCYACRLEHAMLNELATEGIIIVGLNYKDDRNHANDWLNQRGNPYLFSIFDSNGSLGFDLGVYGAPETYLVDRNGIIRHKRVGIVDERIWLSEFQELYLSLKGQNE